MAENRAQRMDGRGNLERAHRCAWPSCPEWGGERKGERKERRGKGGWGVAHWWTPQSGGCTWVRMAAMPGVEWREEG